MKYRKKPIVIEAITFKELIEYGKKHANSMVDGQPWNFEYQGQQITRECNGGYIIPTLEGNMIMTEGDMLLTGVSGEIYPCKKDIFEQTYEKAEDKENED